jgi:hypothetical protein
MNASRHVFALVGTLLVPAMALAQGQDSTHEAHMHHMQGVEMRGDTRMGFSHALTTHHFLLFRDGGMIQVTANDSTDAESIRKIRDHLTQVAAAFARGDFSMPMFIHDRVPPGVPAMKKLRTRIHYAYQEVESGARVRITTHDRKALGAVHDFLRFQIRDHGTGDPEEVRPPDEQGGRKRGGG